MTVKARLDGHEFDLQDLADRLASGDTRVVKDDAGYYLTSTHIDHSPDGKTFYEAAQELLPKINGLGRVHNASFRSVQLSGKYEEGDHRHTVVQAGVAEVRARVYGALAVTDGNGVPTPQPPPPGPRRAALIANDPDVDEALEILGQDEPGWVELYKVHEIVQANLGGPRLKRLPDIAAHEHDAFGASANLPSVSGRAARHARMAGYPKRTMTLPEARDFIGRLVTAWMDHLVRVEDQGPPQASG